jgi:8-oxo-dGTP diphosphatase
VRRYVLGFVFDRSYCDVLLLERTKADWQMGMLNGLGGKIEDGEIPEAAMGREFVEETRDCGLRPGWTVFGRLSGKNDEGAWEVWLFRGEIDHEFPDDLQYRRGPEGRLVVVPVDDLGNWAVQPNLRYLVPMARNHARRRDACRFFDVRETTVEDTTRPRSCASGTPGSKSDQELAASIGVQHGEDHGI